MSDIDPQKLEEALDRMEQMPRGRYADLILAAARAHLSTLPRWKEVEVERWSVVSPTGEPVVTYAIEAYARRECPLDHYVVRLTGTAKVWA